MAKMEHLNQIQYFKNAIDVYSGPDPLKPRYDYIMWLETNVGKENSDVNSCLEQTLQKFQNDPRYSNDIRFVELLILFTRLKGDKLSYFENLYECQLGAKCAIFYKAWSDELVKNNKFLEGYKVLGNGLNNNAEPKDILRRAEKMIEGYIGKKIILGRACCELLNRPCPCSRTPLWLAAEPVKNWESMPLKPGDVDDFTCPIVLPEPDNPNKRPMYSKHLVYSENGEYQLEEVRAFQYFEKLRALVNDNRVVEHMSLGTPAKTPNPPSTPSSKEHQQPVGDLSCSAHSSIVDTKVELSLVQGMWESPNPPGRFSQPKVCFKVPDVPKAVTTPAFAVYNDSIIREPENAGVIRGSGMAQKGRGLSERKLTSETKGTEGVRSSTDQGVKHQLIFSGGIQESASDTARDGAAHKERRHIDDDLAMLLDPIQERERSSPPFNKMQAQNDWILEDVTCNTKVFNNCLKVFSTPNMKAKEDVNTPQAVHISHACVQPKSDAGILSVILEASKETPNSACSNNENKPPNILDVERSMEKLELNTSDPFCPKLVEKLLVKVNYPNNFDSVTLKNYHIMNSRMPNITKTLKLGDQVYSLTGESFKGAYAKVLKVTCNDRVHALKIEKPPCHWEYYICKEIRRRLNPDHVKYFADITNAYFFQSGSILILDWAKYGTLLNVINQTKLSSKVMDTPIRLFFCLEILNAVYYLNTHCNIIHADIKPDNFVVFSLPNLVSGPPYVQLIDFGRSIDMRLMPNGCKFTNVVTTDGFQCNEMKENKPWTYQTDLYGLAGTMYCILVGDYMKVIKKDHGYVLTRPLPRLYQAFWNPIFKELLNIESCDALPDLSRLQKILEESYSSYDSFVIRNSFNSLTNVLHGN